MRLKYETKDKFECYAGLYGSLLFENWFYFFLYVVAFGKTKFLQIFKSYNIEAKINGNLHKWFRVTTIA